jgi:peptide-methionine (S)-S-oxide reductase
MNPSRPPRFLAFSTALLLLIAIPVVAVVMGGSARSDAASAAKPAAPTKGGASAKTDPPQQASGAGISHAYLAGGCFWCLETAFEGVPGVVSVVSGYTGGPEKNPTYAQVSADQTGHYESVDVAYDAKQISYEKLLDIFWHNIDPTQGDGQFCDRGPQYRSAIFARDAAQRAAAEKSKREIKASGRLKAPIVTAILPAGEFWPAEDYHQDFWKKSPVRYKSYRFGCGRDQRLDAIWGRDARRGSVTH